MMKTQKRSQKSTSHHGREDGLPQLLDGSGHKHAGERHLVDLPGLAVGVLVGRSNGGADGALAEGGVREQLQHRRLLVVHLGR